MRDFDILKKSISNTKKCYRQMTGQMRLKSYNLVGLRSEMNWAGPVNIIKRLIKIVLKGKNISLSRMILLKLVKFLIKNLIPMRSIIKINSFLKK